MKSTLLLLPLSLLGLGQDGSVSGTISIRFGPGGMPVAVAIGPDGVMTVEQRPTPIRAAGAERRIFHVGPPSYDRIRALLKPLRGYAGKTLPCDPVPRTPLFPGGTEPVTAIVRWDGIEVKAPLGCLRGPAQDEIELIRAAIDESRSWATETAKAYDGVSNTTMVIENAAGD